MVKKQKILVADDDNSITELLAYNLQQGGFEIRIAADGREAVEVARTFQPDLILMDIMMPGIDGVEACRQIRDIQKLKDVYVIFLTARSEEYSEIAAFDAGANDYILKPIKPRALMSRITAFFRRDVTGLQKKAAVTVKGLTMDKESFTVLKGESKIILAKKEFELLYFLCTHPNKIFNREELLKKVWGTDVFVVSRTVDVHIRKIREKIGEGFINTVKGIGYKIETGD
jgi:two-component system, OmpR family, alkaline phosphatase synthesis response regulator PhoP